jgi:hypothetical protein
MTDYYADLDEFERLELARHIVEQGDEAGFSAEEIEAAREIVAGHGIGASS